MRIAGMETDAWIEFDPQPDVSARTFSIAAAQGGYRIATDSVALLETQAFLADLARFERERWGIARLIGTHDFELTVERHGPRGDALIRFRVFDRVMVVGTLAGQCRLDGVVLVPGEAVRALIEDFNELLRPCS